MATNLSTAALVFCSFLFAGQLSAKDKIYAYFSNDSLNGLKFSDAYETHNMGLIYNARKYYLRLDLGIVSPDMYSYRNKYREANRSFGEIISLEIGELNHERDRLRFYMQVKATGKYGIDKLQDFAHRLLSLQEVNKVNDLIRMPADAWIGVGFRSTFEPRILNFQNTKLDLDSFVGSDTSFLTAKITKEFYHPLVTYDLSAGGRFVAYDNVVSAAPIYAKERSVIPEISFGLSHRAGPFKVFVRDTFSFPTIKADNNFYGVLSAGVSYDF